MYRSEYGVGAFNGSAKGDTRFAPVADARGETVPTLYGGDTRTVVLLETVFHDVHGVAPRVIYEGRDLAGRGLATLTSPTRLPLVDLRDDALQAIGLDRTQLVTTTPAHYACTREWGMTLHERKIGGVAPAGLLWRSRVAELARFDSLLLDDLLAGDSAEVFVLFGSRAPTDAAAYAPGEPHYGDLIGGEGRLLLDHLATHLDATIHPNQ